MVIEKIPFDPLTATDDMWELVNDFSIKMHEYLRPNDPQETKEKRRQAMILQAKSKELDIELFAISKHGEKDVIGSFVLAGFHKKHPNYKNNAKLMISEIELLPEYRKQGIARQLLPDILDFAKRNKKKLIISDSGEQTGPEFINHIGGVIAQTNIENRVYLNEIDWDLMNKWIDEGEKRNPDVELKFFKEVPKELMDRYIKTYEKTMNQIPRDDVAIKDLVLTEEIIRKEEDEMKQLGSIKLSLVSIEPNGDISALTELSYSPTRKQRIDQGLTSVFDAYRGRGLGKWIKAEMLKKAIAELDGVEFISTSNATSNAPMLYINEKIGFRKYKEDYTLQIAVKKLKKYVKKSKINK